MNEQIINAGGEIEIDLKRLAEAVIRKAWVVVLSTVVGAVLALVGTLLFVTPQYKSSAMFYVNNTDISVGSAKLSLSSSDISASRGLVDTYIVILKTRETLNDVIDYAGVDITYEKLSGIISAEAVNDTEVFRVVVTSPDPNEAEQLANAIAYILPKRISSIVEGASTKVVDAAVVATQPSSPSYMKNTLLGFAVGLMFSVGIILLRELMDVTVRTEEDILRATDHPVLAAVPDMTAPGKGGYYYGYGKAAKKPVGLEPVLVGSEISFAASEAYKLLRTKLQYSFADENACRVIGVSSAITGEGKSLTAVNLAHTLSQLDKRVLLIDSDMRRPSLTAKLPIAKRPGLSGYLSGQNRLENLIQPCGIKGEEAAFHVIASGQTPPNPVELLSSARMAKLLALLRTNYDYIILDLPPVGEVSDALAVAKETDGILLVVRQNLCSRVAMTTAIRQFEFVGSRLLGITYNCIIDESGGYSKAYKNAYGKTYARAGSKKNTASRYTGSFLQADKAHKAEKKSEQGSRND